MVKSFSNELTNDNTKGIDPVCRMQISKSLATKDNYIENIRGKTYYFCSKICREVFLLNPTHYLRDK